MKNGGKGVEFTQCAFLSFSLYNYIFWRTSVPQWTDCWKDNKMPGYSDNSNFRKPWNSWGQRAHLEVILSFLFHTGPARINHMLWSTVVVPHTFLESTGYPPCLPKDGQALVQQEKTGHWWHNYLRPTFLACPKVCTRILWCSSGGFGLHSKWSIDMPVEYSKHRSTGKKKKFPCFIFCLVFMYMSFPLTYAPIPKVMGILKIYACFTFNLIISIATPTFQDV